MNQLVGIQRDHEDPVKFDGDGPAPHSGRGGFNWPAFSLHGHVIWVVVTV